MSKNLYLHDLDVMPILNKEIRNPPWESRGFTVEKEIPTIYPTEASVEVQKGGVSYVEGACIRATWFRLNRFPEDDVLEDRMPWIWKVGKDTEDAGNALLKQAGYLVGKSIRFQRTETLLPISGEMDTVCAFVDPDGKLVYFVIDFKTTGGNYYGITQLLGNSKVSPFPKIPNLLQLMIYLYIDERLKFGKLVYLIRDNLVGTEFTVQLNEKGEACVRKKLYHSNKSFSEIPYQAYPEYTIKEIFRRYNLIGMYYQKKQIPPPDFDIVYSDSRAKELHSVGKITDNQLKDHSTGKKEVGDYQCSNCKFKSHCLKAR